MQAFQDLKVWQLAQDLAVEIYRMTAHFPSEERYGLMSQMRRAAVSISSNIAEGSKKKSTRDFAHFLNIAEGSAAELRSLMLLANRLQLLNDDGTSHDVTSVERMLWSLRERIESGSETKNQEPKTKDRS
jgi:four helix bundle protein